MSQSKLNRQDVLNRVHANHGSWDIVVIGGGATGVAIAMDAAIRGLSVVLVEQSDFGKGTSSRSTKLVHGGVRYLQQGNITLVRDALRERALLRANAPHLVHDLPFVIPCQNWWQRFFYGLGLKVYDFLAVGNSLGSSRNLSVSETMRRVPVLNQDRLKGGVLYHDGQFDDARLLISMVQTAHDAGACLLNYMQVTSLVRDDGQRILGVNVCDAESGQQFSITGRAVINATGPFSDAIRLLDNPNQERMIAPSQGVHLVLPRELFPGDTAIIVPKTSDGRVIFVIPWHQHAIVGTTDTPIDEACLEPKPQAEEVAFLLATAADYFERPPEAQDVLAYFTGIRPLVKGDKSARTASLSRDHVIRISEHGLVTIAGGKWTTVRKMAEDCIDKVVQLHQLAAQPCSTKNHRLRGATDQVDFTDERAVYGTDISGVQQLERDQPILAESLSTTFGITAAQVIWAARHEMARTVEDVLARRTRVLFLDARAAVAMAPAVAAILADELGHDAEWCQTQVEVFEQLAQTYIPVS
ncbi:MAG: FAD-dependent oxidoreductase [Rubripirellula sp.]